MMTNDEVISTYLHECGHAVIAHRLGFRVIGIRTNGTAAVGEQAGTVDIADLDDTRNSAIVYAGGEAADWVHLDKVKKWNAGARYRGGSLAAIGHFPTISNEDGAGIRRYLNRNYFSGVAGKNEFEAIRREARRMVSSDWDNIINVAEALSDNGDEDGTAKLDRAGFLKAIK